MGKKYERSTTAIRREKKKIKFLHVSKTWQLGVDPKTKLEVIVPDKGVTYKKETQE